MVVSQEDSIFQDFQKEFETFNKGNQEAFEQYKQQNDSVFLNYLTDSWKEFKLEESRHLEKPKPLKQPVFKHPQKSLDETPSKNSIFIKDTKESEGEPEIDFKKGHLPDSPQLDYYGSDLSDQVLPIEYPRINHISKEGIRQYFSEGLHHADLNLSIESLQTTAQSHKQNDWGYLTLLKKASHAIYTEQCDRVLFTWYALSRSGFNVRLGYNSQSTYLLIACKLQIYNTSYFLLDGIKYYVIDISGEAEQVNQLMIHEKGYPDATRPISFSLKEIPKFNKHSLIRKVQFQSDSILFDLNLNFIQYLNDYPDLELKAYFKVRLSENILFTLNEFFKARLKGLDNFQQVNLILEFVQYAIPYKSDNEQFGTEKYMFAEEVFYYPFADCEDRSVLFATLVEQFTGLKTIGLNYPNHVSVGVAFKKSISGESVLHNGLNYYICDPTYLGASSGQVPDELKNLNPTLIEYD